MKFRFYITDLMDGCIRGTDSLEQATLHAGSEDCFVVDTEDGTWIMTDGDKEAITAARPISEAEGSDIEDPCDDN